MKGEADGSLRSRALSGVVLVGLRGLALRIIAFGGNVALAHVVAPTAFGQVAFALALVSVGRFLADGGMGASLIRAVKEPDRADVAACAGAQVLVTGVVVALCSSIVAVGGEIVFLTWVAALSLPLVALRTSSVIVLERRLEYGPIVLAETFEVGLSYAVAVGMALAGGGVTGIVIGTVVGAAGGSLLLPLLARGTWTAPSLDLARVRSLLAFTAAYQSIAVLNLVRDEGVNVGIFLIAGSSVLGVWTLAYRLLQVPFLLFEGLWRVSFPAMAKLVAAGEDVREILERGVAVAGVWTGFVLCAMVGGAPCLVPVIFGTEWSTVADALPAAALSLLIGGPISAAGAGYLFAVGDAARVVRATAVHTCCWLGIGLSLLPVVGVGAISLGWLAGGIAETWMLARGLKLHAGARLSRSVMVTSLPAVIAGSAGWAVAASGSPGLGRGALASSLAVLAYAGLLAWGARPLLRDGLSVISLRRRFPKTQE